MSTSIRRDSEGYQSTDDLLRAVMNGEPESEPESKRLPPHPKTLAAQQERTKRPYTRRETTLPPATAFDWDAAKPVVAWQPNTLYCSLNKDLNIYRPARAKLFADIGGKGGRVLIVQTRDAFAITRASVGSTDPNIRTCNGSKGNVANIGTSLQALGFPKGRYPLHYDEERRALIAYKAEREG